MNNSMILIKGKIVPTIKIKGKTNASIIRIYPELENIEITPTLEDQKFKSEMYGFNEINVKGVEAYIDEDIQPEYIREGVDILGVVGNYKGVDTSDATVSPEDVLEGKTVYVNNQKVVGKMINNGELMYVPTEEKQVVPSGFTTGGTVEPVDITTLSEYQYCLDLSNQILAEYIPYNQVEYISSEGGAGLNLGIPLWSVNNWKVEVTLSISSFYNYQHMFSVADDDIAHESWGDQTGYYYVRLASGNKQTVGTLSLNKTHTLTHDFQNGTCYSYIDGVLKNTTTFGSFIDSNNLRFGKRDEGSFIGKLYSIKLYQNGNLVKDFIPVTNKETQEATLFDLITKTFATTYGDNLFIAGALVEMEEM